MNKVSGFNVHLNEVKSWWDKRHCHGYKPQDFFVPTQVARENPLIQASSYPALQALAQEVHLTRLNPQARENLVESGLKFAADGLTGIPGAVVSLVKMDGELRATLHHNGNLQSLPVERKCFREGRGEDPSSARVKLPNGREVHFRSTGATPGLIGVDVEEGNFAVRCSFFGEEVVEVAPHSYKWSSGIRFDPRAEYVEITSLQPGVLKECGPNFYRSAWSQEIPQPEELYLVADDVMGRLAELRKSPH